MLFYEFLLDVSSDGSAIIPKRGPAPYLHILKFLHQKPGKDDCIRQVKSVKAKAEERDVSTFLAETFGDRTDGLLAAVFGNKAALPTDYQGIGLADAPEADKASAKSAA